MLCKQEWCQWKTTSETSNETRKACGMPVETQQHVLEDCEVLHLVGEYKLYIKEIFSNNPNKLKTIATNTQNVMDLAPVPLTLFRSNSKFDQNWERSNLK